ncbi:MAG: helix-turn-helix domain-containing protein [Candidatus Fimenecus sp.]
MHYTQRMEDLRKDRDLKQEAVAIMLGITRQQYQLYESGKRKLPIDKLMQLCRFYNISADYLLGFTNTPNPLPKK